MSVLAMAEITLSFERDISSVHRFYKIAASTTTPAAWTASQTADYIANGTIVSGWSLTEPAYDNTATNSLYFFDLTVFSDNTYNKTDISKSSSYEAAKQAYEEAIAAQDAAATIEQYFWADAEGAHVTSVPKDDFLDDPSDGNVLITSDALKIREALQTLAEFTKTGVAFSNEDLQNMARLFTTTETDEDGNTSTHGVLSLGAYDNPCVQGYKYQGHGESGLGYAGITMEAGADIIDTDTEESAGYWSANVSASSDDVSMRFKQIVQTAGSSAHTYEWILGIINGMLYFKSPDTPRGTFYVTADGDVHTDANVYAHRVCMDNNSSIYIKKADGTYQGALLFIGTTDIFYVGTGDLATRIRGSSIGLSTAPTIGSHDSAIGKVETASGTVSNLASSGDIAKQTSAKLALGAGTWVITGAVRYTSNATGRRGINLYIGTDAYEASYVTCAAASGTTTKVQTTMPTSQSSDFTVYIGMQQNSGSALNGQWYLRAARIA